VNGTNLLCNTSTADNDAAGGIFSEGANITFGSGSVANGNTATSTGGGSAVSALSAPGHTVDTTGSTVGTDTSICAGPPPTTTTTTTTAPTPVVTQPAFTG
jgi:hypothetical protein